MTKGQRAMAVAMIYPEPEKGGRGNSSKIEGFGVANAYVSYARTILKFAPELAPGVLAGSEKLDIAYQEAKAAF